jgi:hypothetical protein
MAKRHGGRRRFQRSHTWLPLVAALLGLLFTIGLGWLVSLTRVWAAPPANALRSPAVVANQSRLDSPPPGAPRQAEDQP